MASGELPPDVDFWDFVACSQCHLPFALENGLPSVPFWLTDCGHVICNDHLRPDQSCGRCGTTDIQLAPLQRQMDAPMSTWFTSISSALDQVSFSVKFQQDAMAAQIRHYKKRHQQFRHLIERMKRDLTDLKSYNTNLLKENEILRMQPSHSRNDGLSPSNQFNSNGKRPMIHAPQLRSNTDSSPHSILTPFGPNRLTLPPGQQRPETSASRRHEINIEESRQQTPSLQQYAYSPNDPHQIRLPQLPHAQTAHIAFQRSRPAKPSPLSKHSRPQVSIHGPESAERNPSYSSRFKPATTDSVEGSSRNNLSQQFNSMPPPPTPQHVRTQQLGIANGKGLQNPAPPFPQPPNNRLSFPPHRLQTPNDNAPVANNSGTPRFLPNLGQSHTNALEHRPSKPNVNTSQRMPFYSEGSGQRQQF